MQRPQDNTQRHEQYKGAFPETGRLRRLTVLERMAVLAGAGQYTYENVAGAVDRVHSADVPSGVDRLVYAADAYITGGVLPCVLINIHYADGSTLAVGVFQDDVLSAGAATARGFVVPAGGHVDAVDMAGGGGTVSLRLAYMDVIA